MKNQLNNPDELKFSNTTLAVSKKPTYVYTEEDLGEGILDAGITS